MLNEELQFKITEESLKHILGYYTNSKILSWKKTTHGISNQTIFDSLENGSELVLKIYSNSGKSNIDRIQKDINFCNFLNQNGIPTVEIIRTKEQKQVLEFVLDGVIWCVMLMKKSIGRHCEVEEYLTNPGLLKNIAQTHAKTHLLGIEYFEMNKDLNKVILKPLEAGIGKTVKNLREENLFENETNPEILSIVQEIKEFTPIYPGNLPIGLIHGDFDPTNFLVENNEISCILDYDDSCPEPIVSCLGLMLHDCLWIDKTDTTISLYLEFYQEVRPLTDLEKSFLVDSVLVAAYFNFLYEFKLGRKKDINRRIELIKRIKTLKFR